MFYRFMLITQKNHIPIDQYLDFIKKCADGGITSLQLREKHLSHDQLTELGESLLRVLEPYQIPLVINDFPKLALELNNPFIHLGQEDQAIEKTLEQIPYAKLGVSIESEEDLLQANGKTLSYVTASAVFPSDNKHNLKTIWGLDGVKKLLPQSKHPLTAIGGITLQNTPPLIEAGVQGIAVIGALHNANDPYTVAKQFRNVLDQGISNA